MNDMQISSRIPSNRLYRLAPEFLPQCASQIELSPLRSLQNKVLLF